MRLWMPTSPKICSLGRQRLRRADSVVPSLKARGLETQEVLMFQFESKAGEKKKHCCSLKAVGQKEFLLIQGTSVLFLFFAGLQVIE